MQLNQSHSLSPGKRQSVNGLNGLNSQGSAKKVSAGLS